MKFLLKIVQGPNAGAEIALVEGVRVTLGSSDACDIVLADPTLPAEACALEASAEAVTLATAGAEPERLEPLRVRSFGSTALAVGPADSPWGPLSWEAPATTEPPAKTGEAEEAPSPPPEKSDAPVPTAAKGDDPGKADAAPTDSDAKPRSRGRRIGYLVLLLLLLLLAAWLLARRWAKPATPPESEARLAPGASAPVLSSIADRYRLAVIETNGTTLVRGDFATRAERLAATAELYAAQPGLALDLADAETLRSSTEDLLAAATEGAIKVAGVTNRVAVLAGTAPDPSSLAATLDALRADVPRLAGIDTAAVTLASPIAAASPRSSLADRRSPLATKAPRLPLSCIVLQPYPCIVLQNGLRLAEGADVGEFRIREITFDRIVFRRGEEEEFVWTP